MSVFDQLFCLGRRRPGPARGATGDRDAGPNGAPAPLSETASRKKGSALLMALVVSLVASAIAASYLFRVEKSSQAMSDIVERRRTFYAIDGIGRIVIRKVQNYLLENTNPTTEELQEYVTFPDIDGYDLEQYDIASDGDAFVGLVPNGPFEGMYALMKPIALDIVARESGGEHSADVHLKVMLGHVSMFQFFVFGAGYTDIFPGPSMTVNPGRVHSNGDLCIGSNSTFKIETVTASGRILASDRRCRRYAGRGVYLWTGSKYVKMNSSNDSGCRNCAGSGMDWTAYAPSTWGPHVKDGELGVPDLRLPIVGTPNVQAGRNASGRKVSNADTTRLLVDPVLPSDPQDILDQKFAKKADIRIINGVWYINDGTWPGRPIWSDHPGSFTTTNEEGVEGAPQQVGQRDLAEDLDWPSVPRRFSYYEYDEENERLFIDHHGVISYGTIARVGGGKWKPGYWGAGGKNKRYWDVDGKKKYKFCNQCPDHDHCCGRHCKKQKYCHVSRALRAARDELCQYEDEGVWKPLQDIQYLQATRSGFIDYRVRHSSPSKGPILPVNFDLEEFAAAMRDTTPGELGSYFDGGEDFNGIVYITNTWPGSMDGLPNGYATLWPSQANVDDPAQVRSYNATMVQDALPFPLCSDDLGYLPGERRIGFSFPPSDGDPNNGFEPEFTIPSCDPSISPLGRPSAVRIINGANIPHDLFPIGLSIVTNLPAYVVGNFNTASNTRSIDSEPWMPVMIGADALSLLSNAWDDKNAPWNNTGSYSRRYASSTTYNFEFLGGTVETTDAGHYSGGIENYPRFLEKWSGRTATIHGSLVVGYASVYQYQRWKYGSPVYQAPTRRWSFDEHLKLLANQPPGAPRFSIHSVSRLNRIAVVRE